MVFHHTPRAPKSTLEPLSNLEISSSQSSRVVIEFESAMAMKDGGAEGDLNGYHNNMHISSSKEATRHLSSQSSTDAVEFESNMLSESSEPSFRLSTFRHHNHREVAIEFEKITYIRINLRTSSPIIISSSQSPRRLLLSSKQHDERRERRR
jgi:hypothetical protein